MSFKPACSSEEKTCGETLCIPKKSSCPIVNVEIEQNASTPDYVNSSSSFDDDPSNPNSLYIYKNNFNSNISLMNFFPLVDIYMAPNTICPNANSVSYNFPANFILGRNQYCDADSRFNLFDSLSDDQFFGANNFTDKLDSIHYSLSNSSEAWHLAYVKAPGYYFINCLQQVYPGDPPLIIEYTLKFINFLNDAPDQTDLTVLLQKLTFLYALVLGLTSVTMSLIYLIADDCKLDFITCLDGSLADKAKTLVSYQIFIEMFVLYGGTASLSFLIIKQSNVYKEHLQEIQATNCLDQSTRSAFNDLFNAVDSNQDSNIANIVIFSIAFLFIIFGKCLVKWREWRKKRRVGYKYQNNQIEQKIESTVSVEIGRLDHDEIPHSVLNEAQN